MGHTLLMHGLLPQDLEGWLQALRSTGQVSSWSYGMFVKIRGSSAGWAKGVKLQDKNLYPDYTPFSLEISSIDRGGSNLVRTIQVWRRLELVVSTYGQKSMDARAHHAQGLQTDVCIRADSIHKYPCPTRSGGYIYTTDDTCHSYTNAPAAQTHEGSLK